MKVLPWLIAGVLWTGSTSAQEAAPIPAPQAPPASTEASASQKIKFEFFEKGTGQPVKRVEVRLGEVAEYASRQGRLEMEFPPKSGDKIIISRRGYETLELELSAILSKESHRIFLYPAVPDDNLIYIKGEKKTTVSRKVLSIDEAKKVAPGGDPAQIIKLLPGVQSQAFNPQVIVRGSGPNDSKYYVDDIEVPYIFHFVGGLSLVPANLLSEVQFDSGAFGAEYGDATGGVVVLRTKTKIPERPKTSYIVNTPLYSGITHERPLSENSSLFASFRRSYIDFFIQAILKQQEEKEGEKIGAVVTPFFADGHLVHTKKLKSGHRKTSLIASEEGVKAIFPTDAASSEEGSSNFYTNVRFANLSYEIVDRLSKDWVYRSTPQAFYIIQTSDFFGNLFNGTTSVTRAPTEFTKRIGKKEELILGVDPAYFKSEVDIYSILPNFEDPTFDPEDAPKYKITDSYTSKGLGIWASVGKYFGSFKITPGIRYSYDELIKKGVADPRVVSQYDVNKVHTIKAAAGRYTKVPEPFEAGTAIAEADTYLDFEKSHHYVAGINSKWNDYWQTEFQIYYKDTVDGVRSDPVYIYNNEGSSRSKGFEMFIRRNQTNKLFGWISYTYSQSEERASDEEPFRRSQYDQPHILNMAGNYKLSGTWDIGGRYAFASGEAYTPIKRAVYNSSLDKYQPRQEDDDTFSERLPNSNSISVYASKEFLFDRSKMIMKFGAETLYLETPILGMNYNYDYSVEEPAEGIPLIPFFELRGEF